MKPGKIAVSFVMSEVLGHLTHYHNLMAAVQEYPDIESTWVPIRYDPLGWQRWLIDHVPRLAGPAYSWNARRYLARAVADRRVDVLFCNTSTDAFLAPDYVARFPTVLSTDATPVQVDGMAPYYRRRVIDQRSWTRQVKRQWDRRLFRSARAVVVWSTWARRSLVDDYDVDPERVHVIPPGVDVGLWQPAPRAGAQSPVRLLFVGGDFQRKGGETLLHAFKRFSSVAELHLVTRAPVEPSGAVFVHRNVHNNAPELIRLSQESDVFVLPTFADTYSMASLEAMAAGLPIITSRVGGIPDIVEDGSTGFLIDPHREEQLVAALERLIGSAPLRREMGERARRVVERRFNSIMNARRLLDVVKEVAEARDRLVSPAA